MLNTTIPIIKNDFPVNRVTEQNSLCISRFEEWEVRLVFKEGGSLFGSGEVKKTTSLLMSATLVVFAKLGCRSHTHT